MKIELGFLRIKIEIEGMLNHTKIFEKELIHILLSCIIIKIGRF